MQKEGGSEVSKMLQKIAELPPLEAHLSIQAIPSERESGNDASSSSDSTTFSQEQYVKILIPVDPILSLLDHSEKQNEMTHLVIAIDNSGSMAGSPLRQALSALKEIISRTIHLKNIRTNVVVYNTTAHIVAFNENNYIQQIDAIKAGGGTCFREAFFKIAQLVRNEDVEYARRIITFLTDGHDGFSTSTTPEEKVKCLVDTGKPFTVHCVGFSQGHNYKLLRDLCNFGLGDGMFRYCENGDGPDALKEKLQELFDFILLNLASSVDVNVIAQEGCKLLNNGKFVSECVLSGEIEEAEALEDSNSDPKQTVLTESWLYLADPTIIPELSINISFKINTKGEKENVNIPCLVKEVHREVLESSADKIQWNLRTLTRNADILASKLGEAISENKDVSKFGARIEKMQEKLSHVPIFNLEFDKHLREAFRELMADIQTKINKMRTMLAEFVRGDTQSIQMLARAHDMRYQAKFSKSRRQRIMDKRALKNINNAKLAQSQLDTLTIDKQEVEKITQNAADYYFCALSQNSVKDILLGKDKEDVMGFGLAVQRPEHVLDEPSMIRLCNISGTFVSRTAMLDALEYKINCSGQLSAHGGFDFENPLGVTTVGMSREPINAWLPLYCTEQHWKKLKMLIEPTLGYFCTLDPLGFDRKQYDVMFMVLGSMVGQITENVGEHQLKQIFSFLRTCHALAQDVPKFQEESKAMLVNFLNHPQDRLKNVIPNMNTLIGRMLSLPIDVLKSCLKGKDDDDTDMMQQQFWKAYLAEVIRRAAGSLFRETSPHTTNGYINLVLQGDNEASSPKVKEGSRNLVKACQHCKATKDDLPNVTYDPKQGITIKEITTPHNDKMDKVMEFWAQAECGIIKNKNQAEKIAEAKKSVKKWKAEGVDSVACDNIEASENQESCRIKEDFDYDHLTEDMIEEIAKLLTILSTTHYQAVNGIPGCIAFLRYWLSCQHEYTEMDEAFGLPPQRWIEEVKEAVNSVYTCMNDCLLQMNSVNTDPDVLVVDGDVEGVQRDNTEDSVPVESNLTDKGKVDDSDDHQGDDNNDDNSDEDDYDIDDDFDNDDDYTQQARKMKTKRRHGQKVTLPLLYHVISPKLDLVQMSRVLICQVLSYHSNSKARTAISGNKFVDLSQDVDYDKELREFNTSLSQLKENAVQDAINKVMWDRTNQCMLKATTIWAFIGYMMTTYKDRDQGFSDLFTKILDLDKECNEYPLLAEKVKVMLLGKYEDIPVIANGNIRYVEPKTAKKFAVVLGEEAWSDIEVETRSNVKLHVYRESDIPNRHGHCNSNPYIPNVLRAKLGMKLLPERGRKPGSRRYKLKKK